MSRKWIIFLCILNIFLAVGMLLYVTSRAGSEVSQLPLQNKPQEHPAPDTELWEQARTALTPQQSYQHLALIQDGTPYLNTLASELNQAASAQPLPNKKESFLIVDIQFYSRWAQTQQDLSLISELAKDRRLSLSLRNSAFRNYIQRHTELPDSTANAVYELIDFCYTEPNSIQGSSMQAELFILRKQENTKRTLQLANRIYRCLESDTALELNQYLALGVLLELDTLLKIKPLEAAFKHSHSERVQTRILQLLAQYDSPMSLDWLLEFSPQTPQQEALLRQITSE